MNLDGVFIDHLQTQRKLGELSLKLFFDILDEARKGPGVTNTNRMMEAMDGREWLHRVSRKLDKYMEERGL
jgi:hypothetical protein